MNMNEDDEFMDEIEMTICGIENHDNEAIRIFGSDEKTFDNAMEIALKYFKDHSDAEDAVRRIANRK